MKYLLLLTAFCSVLIHSPLMAQSAHYFGNSKQVNDSIKTLLEAMEEPTFMNRANYF